MPFSVELPIDISAVEEGRLALVGYLEQFGLGVMGINRIEVILEEIVSNVVRHSRGCDFVRISANHANGTVELLFEDNGEAFNPLGAQDPDAFTTVADAVLGGQGIPLVKRLSRSLDYRRAGGINQLTSIVEVA